MKLITTRALLLTLLAMIIPIELQAQDHPKLILTKAGVETIRKNLGQAPLFDTSVQRAQEQVDAEIVQGIDTPIPKDYSGGYTHERHKLNFVVAQKAGALYQILDDEKYAGSINIAK